jgi:uncharacterized protein YacL
MEPNGDKSESVGDRRDTLVSGPIGRIVRYAGLILGIVIGWNLGVALRPSDSGADWYGYPIVLAASLGALMFIGMPYLTLGAFTWLRREIRKIEASDLIAAGLGLLVGGLLATLLALPISMLPEPFGQYLPFVVAVVVCSIAVLSTVTKKRELLSLIGRSPDAALANQSRGDKSDGIDVASDLLLDTSAIIDGRVADLALAGFLRDTIVVPQFVLYELQLVADSADPGRRSRGQRGLQTLEKLSSTPGLSFEIREIHGPAGTDVDARLAALALQTGATIFTGDSNLEKVASLQGVRVLNIHTLAKVMRPSLSQGDSLSLDIVQPGREYDQGVGFLTDGTMVVVDGGERFVGSSKPVIVTRILQTSGGRMVFARLKNDAEAD